MRKGWRHLLAAVAVAFALASAAASTAAPAAQWQAVHVAFGIRCDLSPCAVQGDIIVRVKGVRLPPRVKGDPRKKTGPTYDELVGRYLPRNIKLVVAGETFRYQPTTILHVRQAAPLLEYTAYAARTFTAGPLLQPATRPGMLSFTTNAGRVRMPVTVRIVKRA